MYLALCISVSIYQTCRGYRSQSRIGDFQPDDCPVMDVIRGGSIFKSGSVSYLVSPHKRGKSRVFCPA